MLKNSHSGGLANPHLGVMSNSPSEVLGADEKQRLLGAWTVLNLVGPTIQLLLQLSHCKSYQRYKNVLISLLNMILLLQKRRIFNVVLKLLVISLLQLFCRILNQYIFPLWFQTFLGASVKLRALGTCSPLALSKLQRELSLSSESRNATRCWARAREATVLFLLQFLTLQLSCQCRNVEGPLLKMQSTRMTQTTSNCFETEKHPSVCS